MIRFISISICLILLTNNSNVDDLAVIRSNYSKVVGDKKLCEHLIAELEKTKNHSAVHLAYLGGLQTIWAHHVINPISKLRTFKTGKSNIERAIARDSLNVEIRFIRLSVQRNAPSFLGYSSHMNEDASFIKKHLFRVNSEVLKKNIESLLNNAG